MTTIASANRELPPRWPARLIVLGWTPPALFAVALTVSSLTAARLPITMAAVTASAAAWYVWALMTPGIERLAERYRLERPIALRRVTIHFAAGILATGVQAMTLTLATMLGGAPPRSASSAFLSGFLLLLPAGVVVYMAVVGLRTAVLFHADAMKRARLADQLTAELGRAQLSVLRAQLQPHFLFNTLNAVIALVRAHENVDAEDALLMLSDLLRATLRTVATPEVSLTEEVEFTRHYLGIEQLRFGDRLAIEMEGADAVGDAIVPTFLLQPFLENAIKHGLRDRREGGRIAVAFRRVGDELRVRVADNGVGLPPDWKNRCAIGCGVSNTQARLQRLYCGNASLRIYSGTDAPGTVVDIAIPFTPAPIRTPA